MYNLRNKRKNLLGFANRIFTTQLKKLQNENIPLIFRPLHEAEGNGGLHGSVALSGGPAASLGGHDAGTGFCHHFSVPCHEDVKVDLLLRIGFIRELGDVFHLVLVAGNGRSKGNGGEENESQDLFHKYNWYFIVFPRGFFHHFWGQIYKNFFKTKKNNKKLIKIFKMEKLRF